MFKVVATFLLFTKFSCHATFNHHFIITQPLTARLAVTRHLHHNFVNMFFPSPHHLSLLIAQSFSALHHNFLHFHPVPSLSSPFSVCQLIGCSLRGCVEMVSRDSSSAQIFSSLLLLLLLISYYRRFHIFHFFHLSRTFRGQSPFSFFLYKALPYCLVP